MATDVDEVFKALGDRTRRFLLDTLHEQNGQTLGELCKRLDGTPIDNPTPRDPRGSQPHQHGLVGREIQERRIGKFERPRLRALRRVKRRAEETDMTTNPMFVYVTYIEATPEAVWHALTDPDLTAQYWGHSNVSDWQAGSRWEHRRTDGSNIADVVGTVLEAVPPRRLVITFAEPDAEREGKRPTIVTFEIEHHERIVRLTVTQENFASEADYEASAAGWPAVMANLKSLLETGHVLPQAPWEMHVELRNARLR